MVLQRCRRCSGRLRQKVAIALAIARESRLLLLDEPTSGLDPSASAEFSAVVRAAAARGTGVLMATHDLYRIKEVADRVGVLAGGRIVTEINPATLDLSRSNSSISIGSRRHERAPVPRQTGAAPARCAGPLDRCPALAAVRGHLRARLERCAGDRCRTREPRGDGACALAGTGPAEPAFRRALRAVGVQAAVAAGGARSGHRPLVALPALFFGLLAAATLDIAGRAAAPRALLWATAEYGYVLVFLAMAVLASLIARTACGPLAASLLAWALFCVAAPRLAAAGVEAAAPTPSQQAMLARIDRAIGAFKSAEAHGPRERALLAHYGASRPEDMPISLRGALLYIQEQHDYRVYDRNLAGFNAALDRQDRLFGWAGLLSPMVAAQAVSQALAGTDYGRHVDFLAAAERYRRTLSDAMNLDLVAHADAGYVGDLKVWEKVPPFAFAPASLSRSVGDAAVPIAILAGWLVLASGLAFLAARRTKP